MDTINIKEKINSVKNRTYLSEHELVNIINADSYQEYCKVTDMLIKEGIIEGVLGSRKNNKVPKNFKKFRILRNVEKHPLVAKLEYLYPRFNSNYYSNNINELEVDFDNIMKLSRFLNAIADSDVFECSINERSFEIFGDEKFLDLKGRVILNNLKLGIEELKVYKTREPFFDYVDTKISNGNVLVVENKDTWYSLKKVFMKYNGLNLYGTNFTVLIYGEGWKILRSFEFIEEKPYYHNINEIYYIGDLDFEGISIYQYLAEKYSIFSIKPLIPVYKKMIDKAVGLQLRVAEKDQKKYKIDEFLNMLGSYKKSMFSILSDGQYIPQEILAYKDFIKLQEEVGIV